MFKEYVKIKPVEDFTPVTRKDISNDARERFMKRIQELELDIAKTEIDIEDSNHKGYQVRHLQRRLREMGENKRWNEMLLGDLK